MLPSEFHALFDALPDGIITSDESDLILYVNTAIERMLGWSRNELVGKPLTTIMPPRLRDAHEAGFHRYLRTHIPRIMGRPVRVPGLRKDGVELDIELTLSTVLAPGGREQIIAVLRDLRERVELERQLDITRYMEAATRLTARISAQHDVQQVLGTTVDALVQEFDAALARVWLYDSGANVLHLRASAGLSREVEQSSRARIDVATYPFKVGHVARTKAAFFKNGLEGDPQFDQAWVRAERLVSVAAMPLLLRGDLVGVAVGFFRRPLPPEVQDVLSTVGTMLATAVGDARLLAEVAAASRAKDEFLAMLGHELRNPLAPILTAVQLMKLRGDPASERERTIIERQARHLVELVDDLLDVSRITRGKIALKKSVIEVSAAIARAIEMTSPLFEQQRHSLLVTVPSRGLLVDADETRLSQVFANLLTNAARYTPAGGKVQVEATREGESVVVRVRDNGSGISAELLPRLFDLFVQGPRGSDRQQGGLGIGLSLVRTFVTLHGGEVSAASPGPGCGSEFVVRLPLRPPGSIEASAPVSPRTASDRGLRVLVVDDNADAADLIAQVLRTAGHEVRVARDPVTGLEEADSFAPEVAVLDIGLPVMDGYELAARLRARLGRGAPSLIAVTGYGQDRDQQRSREAGFFAHLVKPVDAAHLLEVVGASRALG